MKKWWIAGVVTLCALAGALLWLWSISYPQASDIGPPPCTECNRAYCAKPIERVRVVHFIPVQRNKPVMLGRLDPEFVRHAQRILDQFWKGEIIVVVTNNGGALFPVSDREMTLGFVQNLRGQWRAGALLYDEPRLLADLQSTASHDDSLVKSGYFEKNIAKDRWNGRFFNKTGNFGDVLYDEKLNEFIRAGDGNGKRSSWKGLFVRSLQDVVAGRCDRIMSEAVRGPVAWKRPISSAGEF